MTFSQANCQSFLGASYRIVPWRVWILIICLRFKERGANVYMKRNGAKDHNKG
jgi:hypothetical protein